MEEGLMAISAAREGNALERYTVEIRSLWGDGKDPQLPYRVKGLLEKLLASTSLSLFYRDLLQ